MNEVDVVDEETSEEENLTTRELCMKVQQIICDLVFSEMSTFQGAETLPIFFNLIFFLNY